MAVSISEVTRAALALPRDERHELLNVLIDSMDDVPTPDPAEIDVAWDAAIHRRFDEARTGSVPLRSWDEVEARIDARLAAKQK